MIFRDLVLGIVCLGLFQVFFYLIDFQIVYVLGKALLPGLAICTTYALILVFLLNRSRYRHTITIIAAVSYLVVAAAFASQREYGQPLLYGLAAEIKVFPLLFYFLALLIFHWWRVSTRELETIFVLFGWGTIATGLYLEFLVDPGSLAQADGIFVKYDDVRGYRYNLPLIFVELHALLVYRRTLENRSWIYAIQLIPIFAYLIAIAEQRLAVLGLLCVMSIATASYASWRHLAVMTACVIVPAAIVTFVATDYFSIAEIAAAFVFRLNTIDEILTVLGTDPYRWVFGVGHLNPLTGTTIQDIYGVTFWPSDVGWIGVLFEFGLAGVMVIAILYYILWQESRGYKSRSGSYFMLAMKDYVRKMIILSILVPAIPYLSGVYATLLALFVTAQSLLKADARRSKVSLYSTTTPSIGSTL